MAVMKVTRTLREGPGGASKGIDAPQGAKVRIIAVNGLWTHIELLAAEGRPTGWVAAAAVDANAETLGPLDKLAFTSECAWSAIVFGVSAHFMVMCAELRSDISDGVGGGGSVYGPFALSQAYWSAYKARPEFDLNFADADRQSWIAQCMVFATAINVTQHALAALLSDQPTVLELYIAQIVGTKAAAAIIRTPTRIIEPTIAEVSDQELAAEGLVRAEILASLGPTLAGGTGAQMSDALRPKLKAALDDTRQYISQVGAEILKDSEGALAASGSLNLQINFDSPKILPARKNMAILIATRFSEKGYGTLQQIAAIANAIGESGLKKDAKSPPPERSYGLFQLNQAGVGAGYTADVLTDPEQNIAIMLNHMATVEKAADAAFRAAVSIQDAISIFVRKFERPKYPNPAITERVAIAKALII